MGAGDPRAKQGQSLGKTGAGTSVGICTSAKEGNTRRVLGITPNG